MQKPLATRGHSAPRSLQTLADDHARFLQEGGNIKKAKFFNNVISKPFLDIPIDQVNVHGNHTHTMIHEQQGTLNCMCIMVLYRN